MDRWDDYVEEADGYGLGPGHPVEVGGLEADKVDVLSGDLLLDLLHRCDEPLVPKDLHRLVSVIWGTTALQSKSNPKPVPVRTTSTCYLIP